MQIETYQHIKRTTFNQIEESCVVYYAISMLQPFVDVTVKNLMKYFNYLDTDEERGIECIATMKKIHFKESHLRERLRHLEKKLKVINSESANTVSSEKKYRTLHDAQNIFDGKKMHFSKWYGLLSSLGICDPSNPDRIGDFFPDHEKIFSDCIEFLKKNDAINLNGVVYFSKNYVDKEINEKNNLKEQNRKLRWELKAASDKVDVLIDEIDKLRGVMGRQADQKAEIGKLIKEMEKWKSWACKMPVAASEVLT